MSEESKNEETLKGVLGQVRELTTELSSVSAAAGRRWRVMAWVFAILCAVIFLYLGWIYLRFSPALRAEWLVKYASDTVKVNLRSYEQDLSEELKARAHDVVAGFLDPQIEKLKDPQLVADFAEGLKARVPGLIDDHVRPFLVDLKGKIPDIDKKLRATAEEQAGPLANRLRDQTIKALPAIQSEVIERIKEKLDERKPELDKVIDDHITHLVDQHKQDIATLEGEQLARVLQPAFEEAAGPVLDKFAVGVEGSIKRVSTDLAQLLEKRKQGTLEREDELKLRYIQLWKTYWKVRMQTGEIERPTMEMPEIETSP